VTPPVRRTRLVTRSAYLAGRYGRRSELQGYARDLARIGVMVTSHWLHPTPAAIAAEEQFGIGPEHSRDILAPEFRTIVDRSNRDDLEDIEAADSLILFTDERYARGGKHFETGYAYALGKNLIVVGDPELTFHFAPGIRRLETWEQVLDGIAAGRL